MVQRPERQTARDQKVLATGAWPGLRKGAPPRDYVVVYDDAPGRERVLLWERTSGEDATLRARANEILRAAGVPVPRRPDREGWIVWGTYDLHGEYGGDAAHMMEIVRSDIRYESLPLDVRARPPQERTRAKREWRRTLSDPSPLGARDSRRPLRNWLIRFIALDGRTYYTLIAATSERGARKRILSAPPPRVGLREILTIEAQPVPNLPRPARKSRKRKTKADRDAPRSFPMLEGFRLSVRPAPLGPNELEWHVFRPDRPSFWYASGGADDFAGAEREARRALWLALERERRRG